MFKRVFTKKFIALGIFILLLVILPLTVYLAKQQQQTRSGASGSGIEALTDNTPIASFNGATIYKSDLKRIASEQYDQSTINNSQVLRDAFVILIERKILDKMANESGITVSQAEIDSQQLGGIDSVNAAKYEALKQKLILTKVKNWQAYDIGFWIPPTNDGSSANRELEDGKTALADAKNNLTDSNALELAQGIVSRYTTLAEIIAVNGYLVQDYSADDPDSSNYLSPKIYTQDVISQNNGAPFYDTLKSMQAGEVAEVLPDDNSGDSLIKVVGVNTSGVSSYKALLSSEYASVTVLNDAFKGLLQ